MSSRLPILGRRIVEGQDAVDATHPALTAAGAETGVDALLGKVFIDVGDVAYISHLLPSIS